MASWTGTTPFATKKQLVSSISGLYADLQDLSGFEFDNLTVSSLIVRDFISAPLMLVSSIKANTIDISGLSFSPEGVSSQIGVFQVMGASTIQFIVNPSLTVNFNAKDAVFGALSGLGFLIFETLLGLGAGTGLALKGFGEGIAAMITARGTNNTFINNNHFELLSGSTQLQISTLGNAYPLYSSITRLVSSVSANEVPGQEIFVSSFFTPGTTCIRSISDPYPIPTSNVDIGTSTIQAFGQWVPIPFEDLVSTFTNLVLSNTTQDPILQVFRDPGSNATLPVIESLQTISYSNDFPFVFNPLPLSSVQSKVFSHIDDYSLSQSFISSPFTYAFQSTILADIGLLFIQSTVQTPALYTWSNTMFMGDFAICEPDETGFRSTGTFDFIAQGNPLLIQWGLLTDNRNSTIAVGTGKRVSWDNAANTSNFIDIPVPQSTVVVSTTQQQLQLLTTPYETQLSTGFLAFNVVGATFGSNTTLTNKPSYPYQFNGNTFINGVLEAQTIIALSSIFATSTFVDTQFSTQSIEADTATILEGFISSLTTTSLSTTAATIETLSTQRLTASNGAMSNLTVQNLFATNLVYSNAEAPTIKTSTIAFGWTGSFSIPTIPQFSLSQTLTTEPGLVYNTFAAASNQVLNLMNFSNTVLMQSQQFSTALTDSSTDFNAQNVQGWASTIFFNNGGVGKQAILWAASPPGEVSFQGQANLVQAALNYVENGPIPPAITVNAGQTIKFTSDGSVWTTQCNAPIPGIIPYNNTLKLTMDFENTNLTTTDTLNINAEQINLIGSVSMTQPQFSNIFVDTFVSTSQLQMPRIFTGGINSQSVYTPINIQNTINSTDFTNIKATLNPNRGFNAFNSVNVNEWNNSQYNIDVTASSGRPSMIVGDLIIKSPAPIYSGQFFINNTIDSSPTGSNIAIQQNVNGVLSTIGFAVLGQYARVFTANGSNWSIQSNAPNPQGLGGYSYPNFYTMSMTSAQTVVQVGQPLVELTPTRTMTASKIILDCPSVRVNTMASPSFPSKESGFELSSYFDATVVFSGSESDAVNPIPNSLNNYFFSVQGWSAQIWFSRIRTASLGIQGFDINPIVQLLTGTPGDFIWASQRYLNVNTSAPSANIRETYFMTPKNYHTPPQFVGQV